MDTKDTIFLKILKKIKSDDFIFLSMLCVLFILIIILFFYSTSFIIKNVNKIFSPTKEEDAQALDRTTYSTVVKRFNLPVNITDENTVINTLIEK